MHPYEAKRFLRAKCIFEVIKTSLQSLVVDGLAVLKVKPCIDIVVNSPCK
jgi:hypothetical protein